MNKEIIVLKLWKCLVVVFCAGYVAQFLFNTIKIWKVDPGTVKIDGAGLAELILVCATYYISKLILLGKL